MPNFEWVISGPSLSVPTGDSTVPFSIGLGAFTIGGLPPGSPPYVCWHVVSVSFSTNAIANSSFFNPCTLQALNGNYTAPFDPTLHPNAQLDTTSLLAGNVTFTNNVQSGATMIVNLHLSILPPDPPIQNGPVIYDPSTLRKLSLPQPSFKCKC